jgi:hypothetical protein
VRLPTCVGGRVFLDHLLTRRLLREQAHAVLHRLATFRGYAGALADLGDVVKML